jgi:hypothetical protein
MQGLERALERAVREKEAMDYPCAAWCESRTLS